MDIDLNEFEALARIARRTSKGVRDLPAEERKAYNARAKRESRDRQRTAQAEGKALVHTDTVRDLLADLAIAMLATDAPGSEVLMSGLKTYFHDRTGWPAQIKMKAKAGKLRLKVVG